MSTQMRGLARTLLVAGVVLAATVGSATADTIYPPSPPAETVLPTETESPGATETPTTGVLSTETVSPTPPVTAVPVSTTVGGLAVTGVALGGLATAALVLLGLGVTMVRRARGRGSATGG